MTTARRVRRLIWTLVAVLPTLWIGHNGSAQVLGSLPIGGCNLTFTGPLHIPVTGVIGGIVIDDRCKYVYLTNTTFNRVEVFSLDTLTLEAPIQVGAQPVGLDFVFFTNYLYVCNSGGENISVVDVVSRTEVRKITVPPRPGFADKPYSIAFGGFTGVFSTGPSGGRIMTIDFWTDQLTHRTEISGFQRMRVAASVDRTKVGIVVPSSTVYLFNTFQGTLSPPRNLSGSLVDIALDMNGSLLTVTPGPTGTLVLDSALNLSGTVVVDPGAGGTAVDPEWGLGYRAVASRLDLMNLTTFLKTGELPLGDSVGTASSTNFVGRMDSSADGSLLAVITDNGFSLVRPWPVAPAGRNLVRNGGFTSLSQRWIRFATPDPTYLNSAVNGAGVLQFYRVPPPPGTSNQATVYQETGMSLPAGAPLQADFDLGNSSTVRKRLSVLLVNSNFSDLHVCTFWLPPNSPLTTYRMRTHTTRPWTNASIYFYASTPAFYGGYYLLDNVSVRSEPALPDDRTDCVDPLAPLPPGGPDEADLLVNGDFASGDLAPWATFGTITSQITGGVFEFIRPTSATPAGVVLQATGQAMTANQILTATFALGNSSAVRKRVTAILHDNDFSDLTACTFWLEPGLLLSSYSMRAYTTRAWANATISFYAATVGPDQWIQLDDVTLKRTPGAAITGTECIEPVTPVAPAVRTGGLATAARRPESRFGLDRRADSDPAVAQITGWVDLTDATHAQFAFDSWLFSSDASGEIQVSVDGRTWVTHALVAPSEDWQSLDVDLSAWTGRTIAVRFVLDRATARPSDVWRIRHLRLHRSLRPALR